MVHFSIFNNKSNYILEWNSWEKEVRKLIIARMLSILFDSNYSTISCSAFSQEDKEEIYIWTLYWILTG